MTDVVRPDTDDPTTSLPTPALGNKVRNGVAWAALTRFANQGIQFVVSIALARLLLPEAFGLVALVTTVTAFAILFVDLGLTPSIVQRDELDETFLSTAFWLNVVMGWVLAGAVTALTPVIAGFYDASALDTLLPVASLSFALSMAVVSRGILQRRFDFKRLGLCDAAGGIVTGLVSIVGALAGLGPMAIVLGGVAGSVTVTVTSFLCVRWLPRARPSRAALRDIWGFTGGVLGFSVLNFWSRNLDNLLVGKYLGTTSLGYYGRAYNLMSQPVSQLSQILTNVLFPALSSVKKNRSRFGSAWLTSVKASTFLGAPIGIGVAVSSPALVETLYGVRWLPMTAALSFLSATVPVSLIGNNTGPVFYALGRTGLQFRLSLITTAMTVVAIVAGLPFGYTGVAAALLIKSTLAIWVILPSTLRLAGVTWRAFFGSMNRIWFATGCMAVAALVPRWLLTGHAPAAVVLIAQAATGAVVYGGAVVLLERDFLRSLRPRRRPT